MPKKYNKNPYNKPATSALSSPRLPAQNGTNLPATTPSSVNDILNHLRRTHTSLSTSSDRDLAASNVPTVHPTLKAIMQLPDILPPRPRNPYSGSGLVSRGGRRYRGAPGPPPPNSWLHMDNIHAPKALKDARRRAGNGGFIRPDSLDRLPGIFLPQERTLTHQTLKALASNWCWHVEYDQHYLATLPVRYKEALLSYVAVYNRGTPLHGLETLFLDEMELEDATGSTEIKFLDLSSSAGGTLSFKELKDYMTRRSPLYITGVDNTSTSDINSSSSATPGSPIPDSWDDDTPPPHQGIVSLSPRFPNLTHLSLSHSPNPSWKSLLSIAPHLTTLTHLSLAYWPTPSLTPNSRTASTMTPIGSVRYGGADYYSAALDNDWREAISVLRRLAKATICLKRLDLEGCVDWAEALARLEHKGNRNGVNGVGWNEHWRSIEALCLGQGWKPRILNHPDALPMISLLSERIRLQTIDGVFPWLAQNQLVPTKPKGVELNDEQTVALRDLKEWCEVEYTVLAVERSIQNSRRSCNGQRMLYEKDYAEEIREFVWLAGVNGGIMKVDWKGLVWW